MDGSNVFSQFADKLKSSFGSNSGSQLLPPGKSVDRRKSMPSMNAAFSSSPHQLGPPSPTPSRPSSRASSFIEDVKQFLAPLSRKSSRNSMYQEYQQSPQLATPDGPKRKTSYNSLLEAMNICKPKQRQSPRSNGGGKGMYHDDEVWTQEDNEVMHIHQRQNRKQDSTEFPSLDTEVHNTHIPLRRKQIKQIESREDRMNIYSKFSYVSSAVAQSIEFLFQITHILNAWKPLLTWFLGSSNRHKRDRLMLGLVRSKAILQLAVESVYIQTASLIGYSPPPREPKKIMGLFKRKSKGGEGGNNLRAQQQQLGDELLSRSTPLSQRRFSNSNLSVSPGNNSFLYSDQEQDYINPPSSIDDHHPDEEDDIFCKQQQVQDNHQDLQDNEYYYQQQSKHLNVKEKGQSSISSTNFTEEPVTPTGKSQTVQPISILKKPNPIRQLKSDYIYDQYHDDDAAPYDDDADFDDDEFVPEADYLVGRRYSARHHPEQAGRSMSTDGYHHGSMMMPSKDRRRYSGHSSEYQYGMMREPEPYYAPMSPMEPPFSRSRRRSRPRSTESFNSSAEGYYYQDSTSINRTLSPYEDLYHHHQSTTSPMPVRNRRRNSSRYRYKIEDDLIDQEDDIEEAEECYYHAQPKKASRKVIHPPMIKTKASKNRHPQEYYGFGVKLTPYMMEEWEITLDDLCDLFPRLDRHYINDFLRSAQGQFDIAKDMIMEMIMEIR